MIMREAHGYDGCGQCFFTGWGEAQEGLGIMKKISHLLPSAVQIVVMAFLYYISGKISFSAFQQELITLSAFAPEGFALAGVLIYGKTVLPGIFIGQFLLAIGSDYSWGVSAGIASTITIEAWMAFVLFHRFKLSRHFFSAYDLAGLFGLILFVLQPFSAVVNNLILYTIGSLEQGLFWRHTLFWYFGNVVGQMLFAPFLLNVYNNIRRIHLSLLPLILLFFFGLDYLLQVVLHIHNVTILLMMTFPLAIYLATVNPAYSSTATQAVSVGSIVLVHYHMGTFTTSSDQIDNLINLNFFILSHVVVIMLVSVLFREREEAMKQLKSMAHYDSLTGIPNRHALKEKIQYTVRLAQTQHIESAICFIDLDGFKHINDTHGHFVGDLLLKEVVYRLQNFTYGDDDIIRLGGDEFLMIFHKIDDLQAFRKRMDAIMTSVRSITDIEEYPITISMSVGIAWCPAQGSTVKELITAADDAMYEAKKAGKNQYRFFTKPTTVMEASDAPGRSKRGDGSAPRGGS